MKEWYSKKLVKILASILCFKSIKIRLKSKEIIFRMKNLMKTVIVRINLCSVYCRALILLKLIQRLMIFKHKIIITILSLFFLGKYIPLASGLFEFILSPLPTQLIDKFSKVSLSNILEFRRINLWNDSINLIASRPIFGLGAAFFPILYSIYYNPKSYIEQHTHNLFLELAAGYGFIVSFIF